LRDLAEHQRAHIEPYRRLCARRGPDAALPTDVFRFARIAAHEPRADVRVFLTSGTTSGARGAHPMRDLSLYELAAKTAARYALFPDLERLRLIVLAPHPDEAPESSLSYMLGLFEGTFASHTDWIWRGGKLEIDRLRAALENAERSREPVALLGTSFAFVHAEDALDRRYTLAEGSRIMQTGGYKGRSREVEPAALRAALASRYAVPEARIVAEYGMTELSSQLYESTLSHRGSQRLLWFPGWMRATAMHPETLEPLPHGELGVLRLDDAATLDGVSAIQTSDLARTHADGVELVGRAPGAVARGCSLAVEEALDA
jgi:hypothetical protein